jgi:hypothetical protein
METIVGVMRETATTIKRDDMMPVMFLSKLTLSLLTLAKKKLLPRT